MTPDQATITAGRMFQIWPDHTIEFETWETLFTPFDHDRAHRAIDKLRGTTSITPTIAHMLATINGILPTRTQHPPVEHISHTEYLTRLRARADNGDPNAIDQVAVFDRLEQNRTNAAQRRTTRKITT